MTEPVDGERWFRRLLPFLATQRRNLVLTFGAAVLGAVVGTLTPVVERTIVDDVILAHRRSLPLWLGLLLALGVATFLTSRVRRYRAARVVLEVQNQVRNALHEQLQRLDIASHHAMPTGRLVSRMTIDVGILVRVLSAYPALSGSVVLMVGSLVVMFLLTPLLAAAAMLTLPVLVLLVHRMRRQNRPANWDALQRASDVTQVVEQAVSGVRVVKGFGQEQRELERLVHEGERLYGSRLRVTRIQARYQPLIGAIPTLGQVIVLALGGWLALHHQMSIGTFLAFATYLLQLVGPARTLAVMITATQQGSAASSRIFSLLDAVPSVRDAPDARELPRLRGEIRFEDVRFGYLASDPVLDGFSLSVAPGETVALVGTSGSGKSSAALLLPRFHDVQSGRVLLDGVDIRDVTLASLRGQVGMVFEDSFLFSDTIRANIAYGRAEATESEVIAAARAAEAHEFVTALTDGYDTVVGERGLTLSGGQRQRIALARALLADPAVLVLDDAMSAVDARVEQGIRDALRGALRGRSTVLVAHRRSTLRLADRIAVVHRGGVVDQGTHEELTERCALYRRLLGGRGENIDRLSAEPGEQVDGITPSAWQPAPEESRFPSLLAARKDMLARVATLKPVRDLPDVDVRVECAPDPGFSLWKFLRPYRGGLALGLLLVLLDAGATVLGPYLSREGIDSGVLSGSQHALFVASAGFLLAAAVDLVLSVGITMVTGRTGERLLFALRVRMWAQLQRLPVDYYERQLAGHVLTRMTTDIGSFSSLLSDGIVNAAASVLTFVGVLIAMLLMNPTLTGVTAIVLVPLLIATLVFRRLTKGPYRHARQQISDVNANMMESLSGVRESQAFNQESRRRTEFQRLTRGYLDARIKAQRLISVYFPFVEFLADVAAVLVLFAGYHLVTAGRLTPGELIAFLLYLGLFFGPIQQLSGIFDDWQGAKVAMERVDELMREQPALTVAEHPVELTGVRGELSLRSVGFGYPGVQTRALNGIDLCVTPGETLAVVGETGAGKSTLVKLIARFHDPCAGSVAVDGVDLRELEPSAYRQRLGYVPQEPFLFAGSVRDNLAYGRPSATDAEVEAAAREVGAHELIAALPGGYTHELQQRGTSLSAGQRQLLCLARARLMDPAILLLDEATANLDLATEARVTRAMGALRSGRTTVLVAHRLDTAAAADRIAVLHAGRLVELGTHDQLLAAGGTYTDLWSAATS